MVSPRDVTALLGEWSGGNRTALNQLLPLVYAELRRVAARQLRSERVDHTLQPTALVHEVFIRLVDQRQVDWRNRAHFFGVAAQVMRRILVDHARRHGASKRGEGVRCLSIDEANDVAAPNEMPILALDRALDRLETVDAELAKIVALRAFGGLTIEEAAHVLSVSPSTAERDRRIEGLCSPVPGRGAVRGARSRCGKASGVERRRKLGQLDRQGDPLRLFSRNPFHRAREHERRCL